MLRQWARGSRLQDLSGWKFLADAFRQWPTTCADYYISVAPEPGTDLPRQGSAAKVRALNKKVTTKTDLENYPLWNDSGAMFTPTAEINFKEISSSYPNETYNVVGQAFGQKLKQRGYKMWSIDEFAKFTTDSTNNENLWDNYKALVSNLYLNGNKGRNSEGVIFGAEPTQAPKQSNTIPNSKAKWKMLFSGAHYDWADLGKWTKLWADEDYTLCSVVCVPSASLNQKAQYTNAFMQKIGRLAFAKDAPSSVASTQSFLSTRFTNLINGWGAVEGKKDSETNSYGTYEMSVDQIRKLVGLEVYSARSWLNSKSSYAGDRIGVRWVDRLDTQITWKKVGGIEIPVITYNWNAADRAALARRIARAIAGAYSPGGSPVKACDPRNGHSTTDLCQPSDSNATAFTQAKAWNTFMKWGGSPSCSPPRTTISPRPSHSKASPRARSRGRSTVRL